MGAAQARESDTLVRRALLILAAFLASATAARAADVSIAVAANFTAPAQEIAKAFEAATGDHAVLSFGASGQIYAQIAHGAPFEVFLSADADRPAKAETDGFAVPGARFTYAVGRLVLWSPTPGLVDDRGRVLASGTFKHLSIADPGAAPYGAAAVQTLKALGLYDRLAPRLVTGASITQALQFVQTGNAELGFVALSQVVDTAGGSRWLVPEADHAPIIQQAVLLKPGISDKAARAFMKFLKSPRAIAIIRRYGYDAP
jgi:molybdate transport system substrate-binding protein